MLKTELAAHCLCILKERVQAVKNDLEALSNSLQGETKSSAGDKHETTRALMNLEQEKLRGQLKEQLLMQDNLEKINFTQSTASVIPGSMISTDKGCFLLCIALGKVLFEKETYFVLSSQSPLGMSMLGKKAGDIAAVNGVKYKIIKVE